MRRVNPEDPVKYDYVLSRVSIMGYCARDLARSQCFMCPLASVCASSGLPKQVEAKPLSKGEMRSWRVSSGFVGRISIGL